MKAIQVQQPYAMNLKERKSLLLISPILIGATAYGASIGYMMLDNLFRMMF